MRLRVAYLLVTDRTRMKLHITKELNIYLICCGSILLSLLTMLGVFGKPAGTALTKFITENCCVNL